MSSSTGWQTKQTPGKLPYNDSGWGIPNTKNSNLTSHLSNPDNWPKLGTQQGDTQQRHQQFTESDRNMQQPAEPTGWGAALTNSSTSSSGWGMQATQQQQNSSGWGAAMNGGNNWSRQPQIDNGTALWGSQNQSGSGWGVATTPTTGSSSWNTASPASHGSVAPTSQSSNGTPQIEEQNTQTPQNLHSSNSSTAVQHHPESWAAAAAAPPAHSQTGPTQAAVSVTKQPASESTEPAAEQPPQQAEIDRINDSDNQSSAPVDGNDQLQKLVNSHEGWGKTPIQQNTSWNISDTPNFVGLPPNKTGTEAWGKAPAAKPAATGWQGSSNQPTPDSNAQQQWAAPTSNPPVRGWGQSTQSPMPPRPPWGGNQPNNQQPPPPPPPPQTGWGDPRLPSPASAMNTNRWNTPSNSMSNNGTQNWGNPTPNVQQPGWNSNAGSSDNSSWGANVQRNAPPQAANANWSVPPPRPEGNWNQQPNMQRQSSTVDDGTSAWGDPKTYKSVNMWDKKSNPSSNANVNEVSQNKPEPVGWGNPPPPASNNKPSPTGWGDVNSSKPIDDGSSSWNKGGGSNWDQNTGWGMSKPDHSNGWGGNADNQTSQWGQPDNDPSRTKSKDFGFTGVDRKTSSGSDNVFDEGHMDRNVNGMIGDIGSVGGYGQYPGVPQNNSKMPGLNGPRPVAPQNLMGLQSQFRQPPPPQLPPQLQSQVQQIRHAVMSGIIPQQILNPQLMTPQHLNHLQHLVLKTQEYQNLSSRMSALHKQINIPLPVKNAQQDQIGRGLRQLQMQIQQHQRALTQNLMQKQAAEKGNMGGMGPNSGLGLDLPPSSGSMPQNNNNMSAFNMTNMSQSLPNAGNMASREQQSRLHAWRRPSAGFENPSDHTHPNSVLTPIMQQSISEMIGNAGILSAPDQGSLLGLHQPDNRPSDMMSLDPGMAQSHPLDQDQDPVNLKNILADIGPPEFIPGKKWAGFRPIDPENDPDITPGSVAIAKTMSVNTVKDVDQVLNRDRYTVLQTDNTALTDTISTKSQPALASSFANISSDNPATISSSSAWSSGSRWMENTKNWMVLTNISPQVDLGTLKNLCNMSGKMILFQPSPVRGVVLVKYQSGADALLMKNHLLSSCGGANVFSISVASDQEVGGFLNTGGNNWNHGSSGRRLHNSSVTMLGNQPQGFGGGPMIPSNDIGYPGSNDAQNLWSTGDNGSNMMHNQQPSWSTGVNQGSGRHGMGGMWGGYDNPRAVSPLHSLLPENLLGEQPL